MGFCDQLVQIHSASLILCQENDMVCFLFLNRKVKFGVLYIIDKIPLNPVNDLKEILVLAGINAILLTFLLFKGLF